MYATAAPAVSTSRGVATSPGGPRSSHSPVARHPTVSVAWPHLLERKKSAPNCSLAKPIGCRVPLSASAASAQRVIGRRHPPLRPCPWLEQDRALCVVRRTGQRGGARTPPATSRVEPRAVWWTLKGCVPTSHCAAARGGALSGVFLAVFLPAAVEVARAARRGVAFDHDRTESRPSQEK